MPGLKLSETAGFRPLNVGVMRCFLRANCNDEDLRRLTDHLDVHARNLTIIHALRVSIDVAWRSDLWLAEDLNMKEFTAGKSTPRRWIVKPN